MDSFIVEKYSDLIPWIFKAIQSWSGSINADTDKDLLAYLAREFRFYDHPEFGTDWKSFLDQFDLGRFITRTFK